MVAVVVIEVAGLRGRPWSCAVSVISPPGDHGHQSVTLTQSVYMFSVAAVPVQEAHLQVLSGRGRKLSGDQITLPTTVDYPSVPKQPEVEDWSSWDEDGPTSIKIEGGNGNIATQQNGTGEPEEPDYFKDMTPTIRKPQKIIIKKKEPLNFGMQDGNVGFSSRLAATQDIPFNQPSPELGDFETWQENTNAWEEEGDATWEAEEVLRQQKLAEREKRSAEQQKKKMEKDAQRLLRKEQNKIAVKLS
ncbi:receptor-binding cancer antigen expressed on SiSo cells isoform X4 [Chiloscyllium plagiosum]|uniref:receptor-binding cancer antigen expressed on SiSo cells isoform X4 n=1 Tax=Chiloscyllium plagiosum TaxID=36176 RepID=UPI001CB80496|nr:receptor-binding cancer antigen expressed on SiSo cells isoform X4 [Chiloscyllium plagiosum]